MAEAFATAALTVVALMIVTWIVSGLVKNASIVDLIWGLGFVLVAWAVFLTSTAGVVDRNRSVLMVVLTTIWGLRLTLYLLWRNVGKGEDYRYRTMRRKHGERFFWVSLGTVFGLQGVLMWVVSVPVQAGVAQPVSDNGPTWLVIAGILLWLVGLAFETVGDLQLATFKADPGNQGSVMDRGLWRYTRHPNYFGDFCVWWGLFLIAGASGHWWTLIGPLVMTGLLMRYSGAGLLEKTIVDRRPGYREYMDRTNAFFPGPPRRSKGT
jgi:steroid 5-alpha reductase family enzyme